MVTHKATHSTSSVENINTDAVHHHTALLQLQSHLVKDSACLFMSQQLFSQRGHWCNYQFYHFNLSLNN